MKLQSRGMCTTCYRHQLFIENPLYRERQLAKEREAQRQRRLNDAGWAEKVRARDRARTRTYVGSCTLCGTEGVVAKGLCRRCYSRTYMQEQRATTDQAAARERAAALILRNATLIAEVKANPCTDCGGMFPQCAMDFDHVRGKKLFRLSAAGTRMVETILAEIAKCDLVCSNCHRIRTCNRRDDRERCQVTHQPDAA